MLAADETGLRGLWFDGQKYFADDCVKRMLKAKLSAELEDEFAKASGLEGEERKQSLNKANEIAKKLKLLR